MNINSKHCYYSKSFQYFPKKLTYLNQSMCREALNSNSYVNNVYLYKIYIFILSINRICSTLMKRIFEQLNDYSECFFFLLGRGLSCCFPLSRSVTVKKINPLFIQPNNAMQCTDLWQNPGIADTEALSRQKICSRECSPAGSYKLLQ